MPAATNSTLPFVSVVIPTLNCREDVEPCLAALEKQDYPRDRFEVIVADNGSTDGTRELLQTTWAQVCLCPERGRARALNAGVKMARGEIICTTDLSCRAEPNWISTIVEDFSDPRIGCVAGEIRQLKPVASNRVIDYQERVNYMSPMLALNRRTLPFMPFADGANASFRKSLLDEIGGFEDSFIKAADVEICYRMFALTDYKIVFDYRAMMWEPAEPNLKALLHQRFRMGIGWNLLRMKYPLLFSMPSRPTMKQAYWRIRAQSGDIGTLFIGNLRALTGEISDTTFDANIRFLMRQFQRIGRVYGRWHLRQRGIVPIPIDTAAQERLIKVGGISDRVIVHGEPVT